MDHASSVTRRLGRRRLPKRLDVGDHGPDLFLRQFVLLSRHLRLLAAVEYLVEDDALGILRGAIRARQIHVFLRVRICVRSVPLATRAVALLTLLLEDRLAGRQQFGVDRERTLRGLRFRWKRPSAGRSCRRLGAWRAATAEIVISENRNTTAIHRRLMN